jgi:PelA/Pel-15E family pectate lyase
MTWQMPHGGFYKNAKSVYAAAWDGVVSRSGWHGADDVELGTVDNAGTTSELLFLADVYRRSGEAKYRDGARAAMEFLLTMQYPSGGFPQVYPARVGTTYSNYVTFNDDAMVRVLLVFDRAVKLVSPLDGDVFTDEQRARAVTAIARGIEYIVNAQIVQDGLKTVWCAQHDPVSYEPKGARSYELASKSGKESESIVGFLMTQPQTEAVKGSVQAALAWYDSAAVKVSNTAYVKRATGSSDDTYNPIQELLGSTMWYRFYDLDVDRGFFSGRLPTDNPPGVGKQYDLMQVEPERRYGYEWAGSYGTKLLSYARKVGY